MSDDINSEELQRGLAALRQETIEPLLRGTLAGRYAISRKLGSGGFGSVYEAEDSKLKRKVALKTLHPRYNSDPRITARFLQEGIAASRLEHPCVVKIYDNGKTDDGHLWLAMELLSGETLAERLKSVKQFIPEEAIALLAPLCEGLGEAHRKGLIHRDLKPQNIMLVPVGDRLTGMPYHPKILDFGIAKLTAQDSTPAIETKPDTTMGTPAYMAPEQWGHASEVVPASDVYSLGVLAYQMLTGKLPLQAEHQRGWLRAHTLETPKPLAPLLKHPRAKALGAVLAKALSKEPAQRYPSALEFGQALSQAMQTPRRRAYLPLALLLIGALSLSLFWMIPSPRAAPVPPPTKKPPSCHTPNCILIKDRPSPIGVTIDEEHLYWTEREGAHRIVRMPKAGGDIQILAENQNGASDLLLHNDELFWTNYDSGEVMRMPKYGGTPQRFVASLQRPASLGISQGFLYITEFMEGVLWRIPLEGGALEEVSSTFYARLGGVAFDGDLVYLAQARPGKILSLSLASGELLEVVSGLEYPSRVHLHGGYLYWADAAARKIQRIRLDEEGATPETLIVDIYAQGFDFDEKFLYYADYSTGPDGLPTGQMGRASLDNLGPTEDKVLPEATSFNAPHSILASGRPHPVDIAIDEEYLYWTEREGAHRIVRMPKSGGDVQILAENQNGASVLLLYGDELFWTNARSGQVMRMPKQGGTPRAIAANLKNPYGLGIDGGYAYVTELIEGVLWRVPLEGGALEEVSSNFYERLGGVTIDGDTVYLTQAKPGKILSMSLASGELQELASGLDYPSVVRIHEGYLYWADSDAGLIQRLSLDDETAAPETIAVNIDGRGFAFDDGFLYYANYTTGLSGLPTGEIGRMSLGK